MRLLTRLKYRCLRLLGVISPSGRYPLPPRRAMSELGRRRFYDAPDCEAGCCIPPVRPSDCELACCKSLVVSADALPVNHRTHICEPDCLSCSYFRAIRTSGTEIVRETGSQGFGKG